MSILNTIRFLEKTAFYKSYTSLPTEKVQIEHKNNKFVFYKPKIVKVQKYLTLAKIYHNDLVVLGKITISNIKMLFIYMDLCYYGIDKCGHLYKLGSTIDKLRITQSKNYSNYQNSNTYSYECTNNYYDDNIDNYDDYNDDNDDDNNDNNDDNDDDDNNDNYNTYDN
ncbi:hypothetical protein EPTV-WA-128 [Eptesipox virus]|uniref:Uncharacterized protein n=1 Tax=Eptesipox virus TaxID=1329402 RepID=A0A220T6J1_9POXV|nr:hypothetical protein CG743_gp128 [Eptesipox virus]ASK51329.1 hypothetical protein EPTV-WA-128 [Eptesipox virus]